jgi:hypothetical protein
MGENQVETAESPCVRTLVCGGRDFVLWMWLFHFMDTLEPAPSIIIHGDARGADRFAKAWAIDRGVPHLPFPVREEDWERWGKKAGHRRNTQMIVEGQPERVIAFPGHTGTENMVTQANYFKITVIRPRVEEFLTLMEMHR